MNLWIWAYVASGLVTACGMYRPSGAVHFDQTTPFEFLAMVALWPAMWLFGLFLVLAALLEEAWLRIRR